MQLAHLKTSPVVLLGPLELLEWVNETFAVGQHHQFSLTFQYMRLRGSLNPEPRVLKSVILLY